MIINITQKYQTMSGFSASDAWIPNNIGKYWNESEKESIAELLFSTEIKDHQPKGIGLSMWRFDIGGCTADQGDSSDIQDINRRAECFFNERLQYDFEKKHIITDAEFLYYLATLRQFITRTMEKVTPTRVPIPISSQNITNHLLNI